MPQMTGMIPIKADKHYRDMVRILAVQRGVSIGALVREAMDARFKADLDECARLFFASDGLSKDHFASQENQHVG